ncbi:MAG: TOMM precursor leader peptide-binding protein [Pseudomonadota bacterium]
MFNVKLQWHPQFIKHALPNGDVLLLSEKEQYLIANDEFAQLNTIIQSSGFSSDFIFNGDDIVVQVQRMQRMDDLFEKNILVEDALGISNQYYLPDFNKTCAPTELEGRKIYCLSELNYSSLTLNACANLVKDESVAIVIAGDLLDPRLPQLNREFKEKKINWLLIKATGQAPSIGPLFSTHEKDAPCYECLLFRLIQNNPVREWLRRQSNAQTFSPVPVFADTDKINEVFNNIEAIYSAEFSSINNLQQLLCSFTNEDKNPNFHSVHNRPQCAACGDPTLTANFHTQPIKLKDCFRNNSFDGGYRVNDAEATIATLKKFISPITGTLTEFSEITAEATQTQLSIYRAAYFQNTFKVSAPTADTFVQLSLGKGISKHQAIASALGEAFERQAAQYSGEEVTLFSTKNNLSARAILPTALTPFSAAQYQQFANYDGPSLLQPQWVAYYECDIPMHWLQGWSLTHSEAIYFPAAYCLANTPFADHVYSLYSHNGNAAGTTQEEAILQGALELIERDAVAIWWYNQIPRPEISLDIIPEQYRNIIADTLDTEWNYWLLDLTHDIAITTCVAIGQHKVTEKFVMGFGCHLDPAIAAQRALTEMYQLITIKDKVTGPFDFDQLAAHPFLKPKRKTAKKYSADFNVYNEANIKNDILFVMELLKKSDLELCVVNYSRPDLPLQTLKVIVPGLCHFWPQLASERLYNVPVKLGWLSQPLQEHELNAQGLYL